MIVDNTRQMETRVQHKNSELYSLGTVNNSGKNVTSKNIITTNVAKPKYGPISFRKGNRLDKIPTMDTLQLTTTLTDSLVSLTIRLF
jgi:hypothetical protein